MVKTVTIIQIVGGIIATILLAVMIMSNQEQQVKNEAKLQEALNDIDNIVEKVILHCTDSSVIGCDRIMSSWYEECKKAEMKSIPSCHDGRIIDYFTKNNIPLETASINSLTLHFLDICEDIRNQENEITLEYGYEIPEGIRDAWENIRADINSCNEQKDIIRKDCESKKGTEDYYPACGDPRL